MRSLVPLVLVCCWAVVHPAFSQTQPQPQQREDLTGLTWKSVPAGDARGGLESPADGTGIAGHRILYFDAVPTRDTILSLDALGLAVLGPVPDNGLLVALSPSRMNAFSGGVRGPARNAAAQESLRGLGVISAEPLPLASKLSPLIVSSSRGASSESFFLVAFHPDVTLDAARAVVLSSGLELRDNPDLGPHQLLMRRRARVRATDPLPGLARRDEVAYIFPASEALIDGVPTTSCAGAITETGMIGQYIATVGNGWDGAGLGSASVGYHFSALTVKVPAEAARGEILRAMAEWAKVADLDWHEVPSASAAATVNVLFGRGAHGDAYAFDGPGRVLAHTYYPAPPNPEPIAGDMHFDEDEAWRVGASTDLFSVALHELGHALGLAHSDDPHAVMYPYYRMASTLADDDRAAILRLYAPASSETPSGPETPGQPTPPETPSNPQPPTSPNPPNPPTQPDPPAQPVPADTTAPTLMVLQPGGTNVSTSLGTYTISGTASDRNGITSVTWTNLGSTGNAAFTNDNGVIRWTAQLSLLVGINRVTIRAADPAGNTSWRSLVITRR